MCSYANRKCTYILKNCAYNSDEAQITLQPMRRYFESLIPSSFQLGKSYSNNLYSSKLFLRKSSIDAITLVSDRTSLAKLASFFLPTRIHLPNGIDKTLMVFSSLFSTFSSIETIRRLIGIIHGMNIMHGVTTECV